MFSGGDAILVRGPEKQTKMSIIILFFAHIIGIRKVNIWYKIIGRKSQKGNDLPIASPFSDQLCD